MNDRAHAQDRRISRREALRLAGVGLAATLLAGCGSASPSSPAASGTSQPSAPASSPSTSASVGASLASQPASAAPKSGGTLRLGLGSDVTTLEGQLIIPGALDTVWLVFDRLTQYDDKLQPQPMLAESWDVTPDGKQITLHLRRGVQFHTGRELTSDDVKYNIQRASNPKTGVGQLAPLASWWTSMDTPDKYTVVLKSDQPRPGVFDFFEYFNIVDKETAEGPSAKSKIVGTGPFKFVEWVTGDHLT
ncbi:MAG: ABC transporter substrate-binding protein, partial [Chloroflexota bacterium]|nr:ABC transporter substrate-binding protein [Chloroflexota bacterium]